jgi:hypothetical protein
MQRQRRMKRWLRRSQLSRHRSRVSYEENVVTKINVNDRVLKEGA